MEGYYAGIVGKHGNEKLIGKYVREQRGKCEKLHSDYQLPLFWQEKEKTLLAIKIFNMSFGMSFFISQI